MFHSDFQELICFWGAGVSMTEVAVECGGVEGNM
jgi:hypothetical protein